ncbi:MAG: SPOR domain-containing protein [Flavobacteriales bacterium]|nr:SPOR domain-containing protein [Flavobacteriales bacterium]
MNLLIRHIFLALAILIGLNSKAQDSDYQISFEQARNYLLEGHTDKALPILKGIADKFPSNANVNYLLGVCYTEEDIITKQSIYHLEKAAQNVSLDYSPSSYLEKRAPVFVYYFLVVAYSQNRMCEKAVESFYKFQDNYTKGNEDYYIEDAKSWAEKCAAMEFENDSSNMVAVDTVNKAELPKEDLKITTKEVNYTTSSPIYAVQVGAFSRFVPVYDFNGLKNVEAFMDHNNTLRYVIGRFTFLRQAETLLEVVKEAGYGDAFIVDVNKERKFSQEVISVNNESIKRKKVIKEMGVDFSVQIGAFKDSIPASLAAKYLSVEGIKERMQENLTILTSGSFKTYKEAIRYKEQLLDLGIPGAFVVAFKEDKKIALTDEIVKSSQ